LLSLDVLLGKYHSVKEIAEKHSVSRTPISNILKGKKWIHVTKNFSLSNVNDTLRNS